MKLLKNNIFQFFVYVIFGIIAIHYQRLDVFNTFIIAIIVLKGCESIRKYINNDKFNPWDLNSYN